MTHEEYYVNFVEETKAAMVAILDEIPLIVASRNGWTIEGKVADIIAGYPREELVGIEVSEVAVRIIKIIQNWSASVKPTAKQETI